MEHTRASFIIFAVIVLNSFYKILSASPHSHARTARGRINDEYSYVNVKEPIYHLDIYFPHKKLGCSFTVKVYGKGIDDSFPVPCQRSQKKEDTTDTAESYLLYGTPLVDPLCLFSDKWSTLWVIQGGMCAKRTYATPFTVTYSSEVKLSREACQNLYKKIENVKKDSSYYDSEGEEISIEFSDDNDDDKGSTLAAVGNLFKSIAYYFYS